MLNRLYFPAILIFWVTMNVLLWRSEFGSGRELGGALPVAVVWQKILTAPDDSALQITRGGKVIGYCRWLANVGESVAAGKVAQDDAEPEGMVNELTGYTVDLEGHVILGELKNRIRFILHMEFTTNRVWKQFTLRVTARPSSWEVHAVAAKESVSVKMDEGGSKWEENLAFADLRNPQRLLGDLGLALPPGLLGANALSGSAGPLNLGLDWQSFNDRLKVGHSEVRIYRVQARLFDRYQAVLCISRVGEILRVELTGDLTLLNDALLSL